MDADHNRVGDDLNRRSLASEAPGTLTQGILLVCAALALTGCGDTNPGSPSPPTTGTVALELVASGFQAPVHLTAPPGDDRLFVSEQAGRVLIVRDGAVLPEPFLDIRDRVGAGGERGLLSIVFHPRYAENGRIYLSYTDRQGDSRVERYTVSADSDRADPASAALVLAVDQPFSNHNGGLLLFGPDGYLYLGLGDGGGAGDPLGNGQNPATLLGSLLRLDVDGGSPYAIPPDNPFASAPGGAPEVWAWGLRNPWRFAFDPEDGLLYVADVGQNAREEVNVQPAAAAGLDYGWDVMEGSRCFEAAACDPSGLVLPALEYSHDDGCAITGGAVYRGTAAPALRGHYVYSDYCAGWVRSFRFEGGVATERTQWDVADVGRVLSFGVDARRELYVLSSNGTVHRFVEGS